MTNLIPLTHPPRLGVNVDHVATLRQQRGTQYPDPVLAAGLAELAGADQITIHLREDRRHIQDRDLHLLRKSVGIPLNLEMGATSEMIDIARAVRPDMVTLVPERRQERTTEGGLDAVTEEIAISGAVEQLTQAGIAVSLFIDPVAHQIEASKRSGATIIELHTGDYCEAESPVSRQAEFERLKSAARLAADLALIVAAGHGLDYHNVRPIAAIPEIEELNIGHSIVCRAVLVGMERAVRDMIDTMARA